MEDDRRPVALEDLPHARGTLDVREHWDRRGEVAVVQELPLDLEERRLAMVDEDQPPRGDTGDLPAELRADRPAGSGDEDDLVGQIRRDGAEVDLDGLAAQDVLHLNRANLRGEVEIAGDQLVQSGQRLDRDAHLACDLDDPLALFAGRRRKGDQELVRLVVPQDVRQIGRRPEHPHALEAHVLLARIVVDEADRRVPERGGPPHLCEHQLPGAAGSDDDHLFAARDQAPRLGPLEHRAGDHPRRGDEGERQEEIHDGDQPRQTQAVHRRKEVDRDVRDETADRDSSRRAPHVPGGHVAPPAVVETERDEHRQLDRDDDEDRPPQERLVVGRQAMVETEVEGERPGPGYEPGVRRELPDSMPVDREHYATREPTAARTVSTTRSCCSAEIPAQIGTEKFSRARRSVSGNDPSW